MNSFSFFFMLPEFIHPLFFGYMNLSLFCFMLHEFILSLFLCNIKLSIHEMNHKFLLLFFFIFESPIDYWCIIKLHIQLLRLIRIVDFVACLPLNVTFIIMQHYINSYDVKLNGPFHYLCTTISQIQTQLNHPLGY